MLGVRLLVLGLVSYIFSTNGEHFSMIPEKGYIRARKTRMAIRADAMRLSNNNTLQSSTTSRKILSNAVICHPPIGFSEGYSFAYVLVDEQGKQECVRGISSTSVTKVSMMSSEEVTLYLNCRQHSDLSLFNNHKMGKRDKLIKSWKVLHYGDGSGNISLVTPCPPCGTYSMQGGWALKSVGDNKAITYGASSLATFDTTSNYYSYSEGNCVEVFTTNEA